MMRLQNGIIALVALMGSTLSASAAFTFNFNESGVGTISINGAPNQTFNGVLAADPSQPTHPLVLTWNFAALNISLLEGDVGVFEPTGLLSDVLRFTDANGGLTGVGDRMIFYSSLGEGALADTGFPTNLNVIARTTENADGTFQFVASGPAIYNGTSLPSSVPDSASSLGLLGIATLGLFLFKFKQMRA